MCIRDRYTVATTGFLSLGKDGFEAFLDPSIVDLSVDSYDDDDMTVEDLLHYFFRNFKRNKEETERLKKTKFYQIFTKRLEMFNTKIENRHNVSYPNKASYVMINPTVEGSIVNIRPPLTHKD